MDKEKTEQKDVTIEVPTMTASGGVIPEKKEADNGRHS